MHAYINTYITIIEILGKKAKDTFLKLAIYIIFEETDTEESGDSQSDVSSLDDGFSRMQFESTSFEDVTDDNVNSQVGDEG